MTEEWLNPKFCSLDDHNVRVELTPQLIELDCTDENLKDTVTAPHYQVGRMDAKGRIIMPERVNGDPVAAERVQRNGGIKEGEKMTCADWRAKHVPHTWKIYQKRSRWDVEGKPLLDKDGNPKTTYVEVGDEAEQETALVVARKFAGEM